MFVIEIVCHGIIILYLPILFPIFFNSSAISHTSTHEVANEKKIVFSVVSEILFLKYIIKFKHNLEYQRKKIQTI